MDPLRIGETIKIKRIQKRITQTNLAKKLKISQTHLSNAENGRVMLSLKALLKLRDIFECTLDELCYPQLVGTIQLSGGRRHVKKYIWSF